MAHEVRTAQGQHMTQTGPYCRDHSIVLGMRDSAAPVKRQIISPSRLLVSLRNYVYAGMYTVSVNRMGVCTVCTVSLPVALLCGDNMSDCIHNWSFCDVGFLSANHEGRAQRSLRDC